MSTTSCPRCTGQVTLPAGVSNEAIVRCPLCHAQYTLAEAQASAPPALEVVEEADGAPADDALLVAGAAAEPVEELLDFPAPPADEPGALPPGEGGALDDVEFQAEEAGDDLAVQENNTDIEEPPPADPVGEGVDLDEPSLEFGEPELTADASADEAAPQIAGDDTPLEFGEELSAEDADAETLAFGSDQQDDSPAEVEFDAEAPTLDFNKEAGDVEDEVEFDLDPSQETASGGEATIEFDNSEGVQFEDAPLEAAGEQTELKEFGDFQVEPTGDAEEIPLDVPDEPVAAAVADGEGEEPVGKKKKKKKKAKATNGQPKGSSLVKFGVPVIIGVPLALYAALWAGYDVAGLGGILPGFMVPSDSKSGTIARRADRPPSPSSLLPDAPDTAAPDGEESLDAPSPEAPSLADSPTEEQPALPADETPTPPSGTAEPTDPASPSEPADNPFGALSAPEKAPPEGGDGAAEDKSLAEPESPAAPAAEPAPAADPFAPDATSEEMPAEGADAAAEDDPFAQPESPAAPAEEPAPAADPFAPDAADDNPFARPASPDSPPAEPATTDLPSEPQPDSAATTDNADPFATPTPDSEPEPAADDPFAPSPATRPADDHPADTLPAPAEPAQPSEALGPRNVAQVTAAEVDESLKATLAASQRLAVAEAADDADGLRKARMNFYVKLYGMANAMTLGQLGPSGGHLEPRVLEPMIREQLTADPKRLESLKVFGARWFAYPKRPTNGVVLAGTVESVQEAGRLYHTRVRPGEAGAQGVTIVSSNDPQVAAGDEVLALGSIVDDPSAQLAGYEGGEPAVVWSGMTMKLSPTGQ